MSVGACHGGTATFIRTRTRSVRLAAAASSVMPSRLWNAIRSPAETLENGPASMRPHHSTTRSRSSPVAICGSAIPTSMIDEP